MGYPLLQDPDDKVPYTLDWSRFLDGDTITTSVWTVPSGPTQPVASSNTNTTTTVWLTGGTANTFYVLKNKITTTTDAREKERSIGVFFQETGSVITIPFPDNLGDVRKSLVDASGRFDLVADAANGDYTDSGANDIIRQASRWLDRALQHQKEEAWLYKALAAGQTIITFEQARYIKEVWINFAGGNRFLLEKVNMHRMRLDYTEPLVSAEDADSPLIWTPYATDISPENPTADIEGITLAGNDPVSVNITAHRFATGDVVFFRNVAGTTELNGETFTATKTDDDNFTLDSTDSADFTAWTSGGSTTKLEADLVDTDVLVLGDTFPERSIMIMPPADQAYTVEVLCTWHSPVLTNDNHRSFWTVNEPQMLVRACNMIIESDHHRNSTGRLDYQLPLVEELTQLYHDLTQEEMAGQPGDFVMRG